MLCTLVTIPGNTIAVFYWSLDDIDARAVQVSFLLHNIALGVFAIIVWAKAPTFGLVADSGCRNNDTVQFVIFGKSVRTTNVGLRGVCIAMFSCFLFYTFWVVLFKAQWMLREQKLKTRRLGEVPRLVAGVGDLQKPDHFEEEVAGVAAPLPELAAPVVRHKPASQVFLGMVTPKQLLGTIPYIVYIIVTTEQILLRNGVGSQSNDWTLGQTLAMFMLLSVMMDFGVAIQKGAGRHWLRWFGKGIKEQMDNNRENVTGVLALLIR
ncbi:hypothetical protein JAAARDRAFT_544247 [Jaapia argillacea MUCL 33604]|uniref:Uncharacterized protein n=1 Tax=Jaapia argillacea MUCL 33604 TaxID=933084 RepID=A0A067PKM6_9AGAM|nr:hypothetical protein JAAARDRAFT_544247 [Jaapia argillacea MUCL 33604]